MSRRASPRLAGRLSIGTAVAFILASSLGGRPGAQSPGSGPSAAAAPSVEVVERTIDELQQEMAAGRATARAIAAAHLARITAYDKLPANAQRYLERMQELVRVRIDMISTGPDREETIVLRHPFG